MSISLGLEVQNHEFLKLPEPKPGSKGELTLAFARSIHPCTSLARLGIPPREKLLSDWFMEGDLGFVFAPRGIGKTWISLGIATALAAGKACGPWQAHGGIQFFT
jgi:AAA domain